MEDKENRALDRDAAAGEPDRYRAAMTMLTEAEDEEVRVLARAVMTLTGHDD